MTEIKLPTLIELMEETETSSKQNALMVLLNQQPPDKWVREHPTAKSKYLPIGRVEYLLSRIFTKWWVEVRSTDIMANSVACTVRLFVVNPITGETDYNDGVGAAPIQTDAGAMATDWSKVKSLGVQMALPIAETYAIKDAAEKFGKVFGKDLNRKEEISYNDLLRIQKHHDDADKFTEKLKTQAEHMNGAAKVQMTQPEESYAGSTFTVSAKADEGDW